DPLPKFVLLKPCFLAIFLSSRSVIGLSPFLIFNYIIHLFLTLVNTKHLFLTNIFRKYFIKNIRYNRK
ncbi:hypothetical protein PCN89_02485, partial [Streptococcus suis]|uniref:hypothetical protein n=1 Tax=Streptococcus suis TaxID=1307 RepID=UPI002874E7A6